MGTAAPHFGARAPGWLARQAFGPGAALALFLLVAIAARAADFGNPTIHVDDQFYLLVGDRLLHGALPFVDIWDRKPIGLFLLYAAIRLLGGDGIVQYQLVALGFAVATAWVIRALALRLTGPGGALIAGLAYLLALGMSGGEGGQSPVFYNLLTALAALAVVRAIEATGRARLFGWAAVAIGLMGCAIQIKYTTVFEGVFFGLVLVGVLWARGVRPAALGAVTLGLALLGAAPTLAAWGWYAAHGAGAAFLYANFGSIFARGHEPASMVLGRLAGLLAKTAPLGLCAALAWRRARDGAVSRFLFAWPLVALLAVLVFGSYYDHYALPLYLPLAVAAAPVLGNPRIGLPLLAAQAICSALTIGDHLDYHGRGREVREIAAFIRPRLHGSCLFVYDGEPILYHLTGSCLPTRWPFPDHLNNATENGATGMDTMAELRRIMAARPPVVVTSLEPQPYKVNWQTWKFMHAALARDYVLVRSWRIGRRVRLVFVPRA